ncbi:MAG: hypothetical protein U0270_15475 [Labilithrix sp.]
MGALRWFASILLVASCVRAVPAPAPTRGAPDAGGPRVADRDNDGIRDEDDRCPDAPEDCDGFEDSDGCPEEDNDKDGVPDDCDRCPEIAGELRKAGCPYVQLEVAYVTIPVFVAFDRDGVKPSITNVLETSIPMMKDERMKRIGVVGHALVGENDAAHLAMRRAEVVKRQLVARGVPAEKLELRAAPAGNVEGCPAPEDGGPAPPCVSFAIVESAGRRQEWDGTHYVDRTPPPPEPPPFECPRPRPAGMGHPCHP